MEELFINEKTLPRPLSQKQIEQLYDKYKNGDNKAKEKIILHNIRLVKYIVKKHYKDWFLLPNYYGDENDLISIGCKALINAVESYNPNISKKFSSYVYKYIYYSILTGIKFSVKAENIISLNDTKSIGTDCDEASCTIEDSISSDEDVQQTVIINEIHKIIRNYVDNLTEPNRSIVKYYFGFDCEPMTQDKIADMLNMTKSNINGIIHRVVKDLKFYLKTENIVEMTEECFYSQTVKSRYFSEIYKNYSQSRVNKALNTLPEAEQTYFKVRSCYTEKQTQKYLHLSDEELEYLKDSTLDHLNLALNNLTNLNR